MVRCRAVAVVTTEVWANVLCTSSIWVNNNVCLCASERSEAAASWLEVEANHQLVLVNLFPEQLLLTFGCIEAGWLAHGIEGVSWACNQCTGPVCPFEWIAAHRKKPVKAYLLKCTPHACTCVHASA